VERHGLPAGDGDTRRVGDRRSTGYGMPEACATRVVAVGVILSCEDFNGQRLRRRRGEDTAPYH